MNIQELQNKKIAILGFGKEGESSLDFLLNIGCNDISILDQNFIDLDEDKYSGVIEISGDFYLEQLGQFDIIIKSPGISPYHPKIFPHKHKLSSQTEIFFSNYKGKVIGVTGTKGKTTTVSILHKVLKNAGYNVKLVGNIGNPVLSEIKLSPKQDNYDYVIYELSSYMLEGFIPPLYIGVLGNIFPDHLNWHNNSLDIYTQAKLNVLQNTQYSLDGRDLFKNNKNILSKIETPLLGEHNIKNISLVWQVCKIIGIHKNILLETVKKFQAIPHRLQKVSEKNGINFIDDAISTTPESTIEAIKTFGANIGCIFLGGLNRGGYNFSKLIEYIEKYNIKNIVLFPETGEQIDKLLDISPYSAQYNICKTSSMREAVAFAFQYCKAGEVCLLSTASPSYNLYKNYIEQGKSFVKEIKNFNINLLQK